MDPKKILLIRMLDLGDVTSIGIPALRHFQQKFPESEIEFLTYAAGESVISLASQSTTILSLPNGSWPDDFLQALELSLIHI